MDECPAAHDGDPAAVAATAAEVRARLVDGGVHRYLADTFYGGGQWPVLAALLAWHEARSGDLTAAGDLLLPEQVPPMLAPDVPTEWLERWGPAAHPLVWAHGMLLAAVGQVAAADGPD